MQAHLQDGRPALDSRGSSRQASTSLDNADFSYFCVVRMTTAFAVGCCQAGCLLTQGCLGLHTTDHALCVTEQHTAVAEGIATTCEGRRGRMSNCKGSCLLGQAKKTSSGLRRWFKRRSKCLRKRPWKMEMPLSVYNLKGMIEDVLDRFLADRNGHSLIYIS